MSAMASNENGAAKRPPSSSQDTEQGESKRATVDDKASKSDAPQNQHPPSRRGIIINQMVERADEVVDFMSKAMGSEEYFRFAGDNGKIMHLAIDIGGVSTYVEELGHVLDDGSNAKHHVRLHLNSDDPVSVAEKLVKAGAKELNKCEMRFWGALYGQYLDPFGQIWSVSNTTTTLHDMPKELERKILPFVSVRDAAAYMTFLSDAFGAETVYPPAKDPTGKIMCAEMKLNGGLIMIGDHCGEDADKKEALVTISCELAAGEAAPMAKAFKSNGGEIMEEPSMTFWGQVWGRCTDTFGQVWALCEAQTAPPPSDEEVAVDMKIGAKYDWKYVWNVEDVPALHCFGEVRTCRAKGPSIKEEIKKMLPAAFAAAAKAGAFPVGPPVTAYFYWNEGEDGKTSFTCGPTVATAAGGASAALAPEGDGHGVRVLAGCKCVTMVHTGPYENLSKAYGAIFEWIEAKGYAYLMPAVEVYENDPSEVEPAKLRTKICVPIVAEGGGEDLKA